MNRFLWSAFAAIAFASLVGLLAMAPLSGSFAVANESLTTEVRGRFTMQSTDSGMLRLDTQTGALSLCNDQSGNWECKTISEDKSAQQSEIDRLMAENSALRREVERLATLAGSSLDGGLKTVPGEGKSLELPSDADVDRMFSFAEKLLKRFKSLMDDMKEQPERGMPL